MVGPLQVIGSQQGADAATLLAPARQVWKIEDFLAKWAKATEGKGAEDPIAVILMGEIDTYKRCLPYLKGCMRGAGWEDSHWLQVRRGGRGEGGERGAGRGEGCRAGRGV